MLGELAGFEELGNGDFVLRGAPEEFFIAVQKAGISEVTAIGLALGSGNVPQYAAVFSTSHIDELGAFSTTSACDNDRDYPFIFDDYEDGYMSVSVDDIEGCVGDSPFVMALVARMADGSVAFLGRFFIGDGLSASQIEQMGEMFLPLWGDYKRVSGGSSVAGSYICDASESTSGAPFVYIFAEVFNESDSIEYKLHAFNPPLNAEDWDSLEVSSQSFIYNAGAFGSEMVITSGRFTAALNIDYGFWLSIDEV